MRKLFNSLIIALGVVFQLSASQVNNTPDFMLRTLVGQDRFNGDQHHAFVGDSVAILNDGSRWKIHPEDTKKFSEWACDDIVHIGLRTSHYWFKREHKFEIYNHNRREALRAMLIEYPYNAAYIINVQDVEVSRETHKKEMRDKHGKIIRDSKGHPVMEEYWVITYNRDLYLNEGTIWRVEKDITSYKVGKFVYLGINPNADGLFYFLISGTEREATWTPVKRMW